jgi:Raf kinase inhibitor-like YbhB/YbcL family protein
MKLRSAAFEEGDRIPRRHTGDGPDVSPQLAWSDAPSDAVELALIVDDPDAPRTEPWVHWVAYGIPPDLRELPEGIPRHPTPGSPAGLQQGVSSFSEDRIGYRGPAPPEGHGPHHYRFTLHALDRPLGLAPGAGKQELLEAMDGHVLATATLTGVYER